MRARALAVLLCVAVLLATQPASCRAGLCSSVFLQDGEQVNRKHNPPSALLASRVLASAARPLQVEPP